ncbi:hypothetical protein VTK73DRAFT_3474 [Phialemonium thermophilum]|uniref:Uncharacterized protein n=1 Tax=Phialemonium thermophilum TaxID=223376 RepID=A0ABR3WZF8_9PEZI
MFFAKTYAAVSGLAAVSSAHILLAFPTPYDGTQNGPLDPSGSNFPCQVAPSGATTEMALGSSQNLSFIGQAVHGGGSCQVSITYDTNPSKNSVWKVIHSIQGGCPAEGQAGNMGDLASAKDPYTYNYQIPDDIPSGKATFAWTWINRIGNREYYMNCAPIELTGKGGDQANFEALPDMVVANIPSINSCSTEGLEGDDYLYPDPGKSVENHPFNPANLVPLKGDCGKAAAGGSSGGSSDGSSGAAPSSPAAGSSPAATTPAAAAPSSSTSGNLPGGVFITAPLNGGSSAAAAAPSVSTPAAAVSTTLRHAAVSSTPVAAAPGPATTSSTGSTSGSSGSDGGSSSGSSSSGSGSGAGSQPAGSACSPEGTWNCVGGNSYQQCGSGIWSPVMPLAAGTQCTAGQGPNINIVASSGRRAARRVARQFRA